MVTDGTSNGVLADPLRPAGVAQPARVPANVAAPPTIKWRGVEAHVRVFCCCLHVCVVAATASEPFASQSPVQLGGVPSSRALIGQVRAALAALSGEAQGSHKRHPPALFMGMRLAESSNTHSQRGFVKSTARNSVTPPPHLGHVQDDELARLATLWRSRAAHGDREAFGIAHAFEVEQRRRQRPSQLALLESRRAALPWWKYCASGQRNAFRDLSPLVECRNLNRAGRTARCEALASG